MPVAPAASRALGIGRTHTSKRVPRNHPTFPHAMVLTVSFELSPVTGLFCHRRLRIKSCLSPVGPTRLRELDASVGASGPHDFAVRNNISRPLAVDRSQAFRQPALQSHRAQNAAASTASLPASVTIMIRPSGGVGCQSSRFDLGQREQIFFGKSEIKDSTTPSTNRPTGKSPRAHSEAETQGAQLRKRIAAADSSK